MFNEVMQNPDESTSSFKAHCTGYLHAKASTFYNRKAVH